MNTVKLSDLVTKKEAVDLTQFVKDNQADCASDGAVVPTTKNLVLKWLDNNHQVTDRMHKLEIIKSYGCYLLIYALRLDDV